MSAATVYRLHSWNRGGPLCGQVSPNGQCNVRYAVDDHGRDVPAWVTCQRCLRLMHDDGADRCLRPCRPGGMGRVCVPEQRPDGSSGVTGLTAVLASTVTSCAWHVWLNRKLGRDGP
jgi:hypothetical protein